MGKEQRLVIISECTKDGRAFRFLSFNNRLRIPQEVRVGAVADFFGVEKTDILNVLSKLECFLNGREDVFGLEGLRAEVEKRGGQRRTFFGLFIGELMDLGITRGHADGLIRSTVWNMAETKLTGQDDGLNPSWLASVYFSAIELPIRNYLKEKGEL